MIRYGPRDALYLLDASRARFLHAARLMDCAVIGDPLAAMIRSRRDIRAARRSLRAAGAPIPPRPRTRHAKPVICPACNQPTEPGCLCYGYPATR